MNAPSASMSMAAASAILLATAVGASLSLVPSASASPVSQAGNRHSEAKTCPPLYFDFRALTVKNVSCDRGKAVIVKAHKIEWDGDVENIKGFRCTMGSSLDLIQCERDQGRKWIHWDARE
jgi:hypothetical protein